jgi:hypothetical protein
VESPGQNGRPPPPPLQPPGSPPPLQPPGSPPPPSAPPRTRKRALIASPRSVATRQTLAAASHTASVTCQPGASLPSSADIHPNVFNNSYDRVYL